MDINVYQQQMEKAIAYMENEFKWMQVWRATTWLVDNVDIETDYWTTKLNQTALISVVDNSTIKIQPRDPSVNKKINAAILAATGLNAEWFWDHFLVKIPPLTQERREQLTKQIRAMWEDTKWNIRKVRQDAMNEVKKTFVAKEISEDQRKAEESNIEELTKKMNTKIDELVKLKSEEVMKI